MLPPIARVLGEVCGSAQRIGTASGVIGAGSRVSPMRNSSTAAAHARPSAIAHTIRL